MTPKQKRWIDNASYETLLSKWRFAKAGNPLFLGKCGAYYKKVLIEKKNADPDGAVSASKRIGW
jgi:hypothetical protein